MGKVKSLGDRMKNYESCYDIRVPETPGQTHGFGGYVIRTKWVPVETPIFTEDKQFLYNLIPTIEI